MNQNFVLAIVRDARSVDMLHHKIGASIFGSAAVQCSDVWVLHACQHLTLSAEAPEHFIGIDTALDDFDRDGLAKIVADPLGQPDATHSPLAKFTHQLVRPDLLARSQGIKPDRRRLTPIIRRFAIGRQEAFDLASQRCIAAARLAEKLGTRVR